MLIFFLKEDLSIQVDPSVTLTAIINIGFLL